MSKIYEYQHRVGASTPSYVKSVSPAKSQVSIYRNITDSHVVFSPLESSTRDLRTLVLLMLMLACIFFQRYHPQSLQSLMRLLQFSSYHHNEPNRIFELWRESKCGAFEL